MTKDYYPIIIEQDAVTMASSYPESQVMELLKTRISKAHKELFFAHTNLALNDGTGTLEEVGIVDVSDYEAYADAVTWSE